MVFSNLLFLFRSLSLILAAYFIVPERFRNGVLLLGSLIFYRWGKSVYIGFLLFSTVMGYTHGRVTGWLLSQGRQKAVKWVVVSSAVINLGLLGFFKYTDFLPGAMNHVAGTQIPLLNLALPIGIPFYTFQTMPYIIDAYRGKIRVQKNIVNFGAYTSTFPQLIAKSVVRYSITAEELGERQKSHETFGDDTARFVSGLGKEVLLANTIGALWTETQGIPDGEQSVVLLWLGILASGMQIYFDLPGYSDMAVGLGRIFGLHFPENFRYSYTSKSITGFWNRWHISLETWFKKYVYVLLGENRKGIGWQICNIMTVWLLTGIWHRAGWNSPLRGVYFGVLLPLEKLALKRRLEKMPSLLQSVYVMLLVFLGWVLFVYDDMTAGALYYRQILGLRQIAFVNGRTLHLLMSYLPSLVITAAGSMPHPERLTAALFQELGTDRDKEPVTMTTVAIMVMVVMTILMTVYPVDVSYNPFLYFRF